MITLSSTLHTSNGLLLRDSPLHNSPQRGSPSLIAFIAGNPTRLPQRSAHPGTWPVLALLDHVKPCDCFDCYQLPPFVFFSEFSQLALADTKHATQHPTRQADLVEFG